jgi:hypothetical protein
MNNMNEKVTVMGKVKSMAAEMVSNAMIKQAELGTRNSFTFGISEPKFPIELLKENEE